VDSRQKPCQVFFINFVDVSLNSYNKSRDKKLFLFLNYFDPHRPYNAPEGFYETFFPGVKKNIAKMSESEKINALYDGEILYMDYYIGQFFEKLKDYGLYDNSWIIVTADHGELLGEHGKFLHGKYLFQQEIHVPLFMKYPYGEVAPGHTDIAVQLTDILPTICKRVGTGIPLGIQGSPLPQIKHPIIAETHPLPFKTQDGEWLAIFEGDYKFVWNSKGQHLLFNLKNDPAERINLAAKNPQLTRTMMNNLLQYMADLPKPRPAGPMQVIDDTTKEALKSLGYLE